MWNALRSTSWTARATFLSETPSFDISFLGSTCCL